MGFKIVEYYIRNVLSEGIARLRENTEELEHVFAELAHPPLDITFGHKIISEIKHFFTQNDVPVLSAFSQNQIQLPSITVHLISSQEDPALRSFQDHWQYERVPGQKTVLAGPIYGTSYDPETGRIHFAKTVDLSQVIHGRKIFAPRDDEVYTVEGTMLTNPPGTPVYQLVDQYITVVDSTGDAPPAVDIAELQVLSTIDFKLYRKAAVHFREMFEIRVNAQTNTDQAIWLYYIVSYLLMLNKGYFEDVGLESQTFSTSEFTRDNGKLPNNIWGRTIRFSFLVQHTWREPVQVLELTGINLNAENPVTGEITELTQETL